MSASTPLPRLQDVPAPAKLNVFLHVVGQRPDGYHLLQSLFVLVDWADTLHFELRPDAQLLRHDLGQALPADDLCLRAARLLQQASACPLGATIHIDKQLPSGAGMGGGSSDAASTLLALNRLWGLNWSRQRLMALGLQLGADVPFFLGGHPAIVEGIGERLTPVPLRPRHYAVVKPPQSLETRLIFTDPGLTRDSDPAILEGFLADPKVDVSALGHALDDWLDESKPEASDPPKIKSGLSSPRLHLGLPETRNDLQPVALRHCPPIGEALELLRARWGNSQMTGSGSAVFARETAANATLMAAEAAQAAPKLLAQELPSRWVGRMCRSLPRHPLWDWAS